MNNFLSFMNQFKQNPLGMLMQKYNIPQNITDPQAIVQHLIESGQVTQEQVEQAKAFAQGFNNK